VSKNKHIETHNIEEGDQEKVLSRYRE